jgi:hypothetical protein
MRRVREGVRAQAAAPNGGSVTWTRDVIDYFRSRRTPLASAALALFDGGDARTAHEALTAGQRKDGSWKDSLVETVRRLDLLVRLGYDISDPRVAEAAEWVMWRQGMRHSYRDVFPSPTDKDMGSPFALPTGERLPSRVSFCHVYGELALKAVLDAGVKDDPRVRDMLLVFQSMMNSLRRGLYCCRNCTGAFWRVASRFPQYRPRVNEGLRALRSRRTASGNWKGFPFYFTLETLGVIGSAEALNEFEFALDRLARTARPDGSWGRSQRDEKTFAVISGIRSLRIGEV